MIKKIIFTISIIFSIDCQAFENTAESSIANSLSLATNRQYQEAINLLEQSQNKYPDNVEIKIAIARVLSWQGNYSAAKAKLDELSTKNNNSADAMFLRGNLAYYQEDYKTAEQIYQEILLTNPDYQDVKDALLRIEKIKNQPKPYKWQIDTGYEHSSFSRVKQSSWDQKFLQLTHFLNHKTAINAIVTDYNQFDKRDTEFGAGINHSFYNGLSGYLSALVTKSPDFRPKNRISAGGEWRFLDSSNNSLPLWLTIDSRYETYESTKVLNFNPGLKIEPFAGWSLSGKLIIVDQESEPTSYGKDFRLDGTINNKSRFYVGYANTPETIAGVTIKTETYFTGLAIDVRPDTILRFGYAQDDRRQSFIRKAFNVSIGYRF